MNSRRKKQQRNHTNSTSDNYYRVTNISWSNNSSIKWRQWNINKSKRSKTKTEQAQKMKKKIYKKLQTQ